MTIFYFLTSLKPGDSTCNITVNKANWFAKNKNYKVIIVLANQGSMPIPYHLEKGVTIYDLDLDKLQSLFWYKVFNIKIFFRNYYKENYIQSKLKQLFIDKQPDILINLAYPDIFSEKIATIKTKGIKIIERHGALEKAKPIEMVGTTQRKHLYIKWRDVFLNKKRIKALNTFDCLVVLSNEDKQYREEFGNFKIPIKAIPNAVLKYPISPNYDITSTKVITAGRLVKGKNFEEQILLWKDIIKTHPEWTLHIYGDGNHKEVLANLILANHLENHVFLEGKTLTLEKEYQNSAFFLFTSLSEGFGMVLVEAMQMGLPVISYDCPVGPRTIITHEEDGYLVPLHDREDLINKVKYLIVNPEQRVRMSEKAIKKSKRYSENVIMEEWTSFFNNLKNKYIL